MDELNELIKQTDPTTLDVNTNHPLAKVIEATRPENDNTNVSNVIGYNTGVGDSKYDKGYHSGILQDLEDYRAKKQPVPLKVLGGLGRTANKVGVELAKIPGYLVGGTAALGNEMFGDGEDSMDMFVNNSWVKAIEGYEEWVNNDLIPVYTKEAVRSGNLWDNVSSIDFWATEGADGLAFMLSMLAPGYGISKLGLGSKMLSPLGKSRRGAELLTKMDDASRVLGIESAGGTIDLGAATMVNTIFEAGSEANSAMKAIEHELKADLEAGVISEEEYNIKRGQVGRDVFLSNIGILLLPNLILNKQIMGMGKQTSQYSKFRIEGDEIISNIQKQPLHKRMLDFSKNILAPNVIREGFFEEGMQSTMEEYWKHNSHFSMEEIMSTYMDVIGSTEGQKAVFLGGLFGTSMSSIGSYYQSKRDKVRQNSIIDAFNSDINFYEKSLTGFVKLDENGNPIKDENGKVQYDFGKLKEHADTIANIQELNGRLEIAKEAGDEHIYNLYKDKLETNLLSTFIKAGEDGLSILRERLNSSESIEKEIEDYNRSFDANITIESNTNSILNKAKEILKDYTFLNNYASLGKLNKSDKRSPLYASFLATLQDSYLQNKSQAREVTSIINKLTEEVESLKNDEDPSEAIIKKNLQKEIEEYSEYKNILNQNIKDLFNKDKQKEAFDTFNEYYKEVEKSNEDAIEESKDDLTEEEKEAIKANEKQAEDRREQDRKDKKLMDAAKMQNNDFFKLLSEMHDKPESYNLIKDPKTAEVNNLFGNDHVQPIQKFLDSFTENHIMSLDKTVDNEGGEAYSFKMSDPDTGTSETVLVQTYNITEEADPIDIIEDSVSNNDSEYTSTENEELNKSVISDEEKSETGKKGSNAIKRKHVKLVNSGDERLTSKLYKEYMLSPRNKTNEEVDFELGDPADNIESQEALKLFNDLVSDNFENVSEEELDFLTKSLPIKVRINDNIYTHLFSFDGTKNTELTTHEYNVRRSLINKSVKDKSTISGKSKIKFQYPGIIQNGKDEESKPIKTKLTDLYGFSDMGDIVIGYSNRDRNIISADGDLLVASLSKNPGTLYMMTQAANGRNIPIKLNLRRLNDAEVESILKVTEQLLNPSVKLKYDSLLSAHDFGFTNEEVDMLKEEASALNKPYKELQIKDLFRTLIFEGNSTKNSFKIKSSNLIFGNKSVTHKAFNDMRDSIKDWILNNKNRNVIAHLLENSEYKSHIINSNIVTTDLKPGEHLYQGNTDIYINNVVESEVKEESNKTVIKNIRKSRKKGKGKKKLGNVIKNVSNMKRDDDQSSNTIC